MSDLPVEAQQSNAAELAPVGEGEPAGAQGPVASPSQGSDARQTWQVHPQTGEGAAGWEGVVGPSRVEGGWGWRKLRWGGADLVVLEASFLEDIENRIFVVNYSLQITTMASGYSFNICLYSASQKKQL